MKETGEVDNQCAKIFAILVLNIQPLTFNRLFEKLQKVMTKPTLIKHLKHLQKYEIVTRQKIGKQKVTYTIRDDVIDELAKGKEFIEKMKELKKEKETFESLSITDKIHYILLLTTLTEIDQLKYTLQAILNPKERYKATLKYNFAKDTLYTMTQYLLLNSLKSKTDIAEALKEIEGEEKYLWTKASLKMDVRDIF